MTPAISPRTIPWRTALWRFLQVGITSLGAARWTYLHATFVRSGWIREEDFMRDLAQAQVFPGAPFASITVLCGLRLRGVALALSGLVLVLAPGALAIAVAMTFVSALSGAADRILHGILIGAVGILIAVFVRTARRGVRDRWDLLLALATLALLLGGVQIAAVVPVIAAFGVGFGRLRTRTAG